MPGKYPLINDADKTRVRTIGSAADPNIPDSSLSRSDYATLSVMFPNSPVYAVTDVDYRATAASLLMPDTQIGDAAQFPSVDMNYTGAPDLSTPPAGFDSSYYPNLIAGSDPAGSEGTATGSPLSPNDNYGSGATVDAVLPSEMAAIISRTTVNTSGPIAPAGQSGANTSEGTVTTHSKNEGADSVGFLTNVVE